MVNLYVCRNVVFLSKSQKGYLDFVTSFLVKYEDVRKLDYFNSTKTKKRFKFVKERRNLYSEDDNFIMFSRGTLELIPESEYVAEYRQEVSEIVVPPFDYEDVKTTLDSFDLRDDQVVAVRKCLLAKRGVIQLPTATGKSAIITTTIKKLLQYNPSLKILVLAPTLSTVEGINDTLLNNKVDTHIFGHPHKDLRCPVTTALVQSLISKSEDDPKFLEDVGAVFYDECLPSNAKILLPDGSSCKMSYLYENDSINEVMSYNTKTNQYEIKRILRKFKTPFNGKFWKIYFDDPVTGKTEGVTLTSNHKVWTRFRGYVQASELTEDDQIKVDYAFARYLNSLVSATYVKVKRVTPNVGSIAEYKYNIEVEDNHNYFANGVLVSNCHHLKCDTWNRLNLLLKNVEYSLGFSALSIDKSEINIHDIRDLSYESSLIVGCSGRVLMHMDPKYYIDHHIIAFPQVFRIKNIIELPEGTDESNWNSVTKLGLMSTPRTNKVAKVASIFSKYKRKTLILVSERDYAFTLGRFLVSYGISNFGISFGAGTGYLFDGLSPDGEPVYQDEDTLKVKDMLSSGEISVLIGTSHLDEGVDIKALDCMIIACGGKKDRRVIQRVGRVLRKSKTGKYAYVVDFTDDGSRVLSRQSKQRLEMYKESIGVPDDSLYDGIDVNSVENLLINLEGLNSPSETVKG